MTTIKKITKEEVEAVLAQSKSSYGLMTHEVEEFRQCLMKIREISNKAMSRLEARNN